MRKQLVVFLVVLGALAWLSWGCGGDKVTGPKAPPPPPPLQSRLEWRGWADTVRYEGTLLVRGYVENVGSVTAHNIVATNLPGAAAFEHDYTDAPYNDASDHRGWLGAGATGYVVTYALTLPPYYPVDPVQFSWSDTH